MVLHQFFTLWENFTILLLIIKYQATEIFQKGNNLPNHFQWFKNVFFFYLPCHFNKVLYANMHTFLLLQPFYTNVIRKLQL